MWSIPASIGDECDHVVSFNEYETTRGGSNRRKCDNCYTITKTAASRTVEDGSLQDMSTRSKPSKLRAMLEHGPRVLMDSRY